MMENQNETTPKNENVNASPPNKAFAHLAPSHFHKSKTMLSLMNNSIKAQGAYP
jgi:hypothetical protein